MNRWKRTGAVLAVVVAAAVAVVGVSGCANNARKGEISITYEVVTVDVHGIKVPCVMTSKGGVSCAWQGR